MTLRDKLQSGWHYMFGFYYLGYEQGQQMMKERRDKKDEERRKEM